MSEQVMIQLGMPFSAKLPEESISHAEAWEAFQELRGQVADLPEMFLEEINAEIAAVRTERRQKLYPKNSG